MFGASNGVNELSLGAHAIVKPLSLSLALWFVASSKVSYPLNEYIVLSLKSGMSIYAAAALPNVDLSPR